MIDRIKMTTLPEYRGFSREHLVAFIVLLADEEYDAAKLMAYLMLEGDPHAAMNSTEPVKSSATTLRPAKR